MRLVWVEQKLSKLTLWGSSSVSCLLYNVYIMCMTWLHLAISPLFGGKTNWCLRCSAMTSPSLTAAVATSEGQNRPLSSVDNRCVGFDLRKRWTANHKDDNKRRQRERWKLSLCMENYWSRFFLWVLGRVWRIFDKAKMKSPLKRGNLSTRLVSGHQLWPTLLDPSQD